MAFHGISMAKLLPWKGWSIETSFFMVFMNSMASKKRVTGIVYSVFPSLPLNHKRMEIMASMANCHDFHGKYGINGRLAWPLWKVWHLWQVAMKMMATITDCHGKYGIHGISLVFTHKWTCRPAILPYIVLYSLITYSCPLSF